MELILATPTYMYIKEDLLVRLYEIIRYEINYPLKTSMLCIRYV